MPVSGPHRSLFSGNAYYEVDCSRCGYNTKVVSGGKTYAKSVLAKHNREKHGKK